MVLLLRALSILALCTISEGFFDYKNDCDASCQTKKISCSISEESKQFFVCHCFESEMACALLASPRTVCLRPDAAPSGGSAIWDDYVNRGTTTTTTTRAPTAQPTWPPPRPVPQPGRPLTMPVIIATSAIILTLILISTVFLLRKAYLRRGYQSLSRNPESPYSETVEDILEGSS